MLFSSQYQYTMGEMACFRCTEKPKISWCQTELNAVLQVRKNTTSSSAYESVYSHHDFILRDQLKDEVK